MDLDLITSILHYRLRFDSNPVLIFSNKQPPVNHPFVALFSHFLMQFPAISQGFGAEGWNFGHF